MTCPAAAGDLRPLLVIVDGQGRLTRYALVAGAAVLARCAGSVLSRDPGGATGPAQHLASYLLMHLDQDPGRGDGRPGPNAGLSPMRSARGAA